MSVLAAPSRPSTAARPYEPSWIHALIDAIDRLPGPRWAAYAGIAGIAILLQHAQLWSTGRVEVGTIDGVQIYWGVVVAVALWLHQFLEDGARASFARFRGALRVADEDADRLGYELTIIPARLSLSITILAVAATIASVVADPVGTSTAGLPPVMLVVAVVIQSFVAAVLLQVFYRLVRQVRLVREILDRHVEVDVFRPGPLHAISTLTARPGATLTLLIASVVVVVPVTTDLVAFLVAWGPLLVIPPLIALVAFVAPLTGAHARLEAQKDQLQDATEQRIRGLLRDLDRDVDARELGQVDAYQKTLAALLVERDVLAKLPTWPWSTATLRGFVSTILLPLALFVVQQVLSRLLN
ncbi:MAG TPA: hypothetical protein VFX65_07630 [Candidatus Limnocylindrales bacterium]|nr:hypothetical protein [Candidatus Limnocylindrales bacterium]